MTIITTNTTTVHTERESTIHIEHFFNKGLNIQHTLLLCGIHSYFNDP